MSESWEAEFRLRLMDFLVRRGHPLAPDGDPYWDSYYGKIAVADEYQEVRSHVASCGLDVGASAWEVASWQEFTGTLAETADRRRNGIDLRATCRCGQVRNRVFRYEGTYGTLVREITDPLPPA